MSTQVQPTQPSTADDASQFGNTDRQPAREREVAAEQEALLDQIHVEAA